MKTYKTKDKLEKTQAKKHQHCLICGHSLEVNHTAHFVDNTVKEEVFCAQCETINATHYHSLH